MVTQQNMNFNIICNIKYLIKINGQNLTKHENEYLTEFKVKTSTLYVFQKVYKSKVIIDAIKQTEIVYVECPQDLTFRPNVAGPACPTYKLSNLIDIFLRPYMIHVKGYVGDNIDFLNHFPENIIFCTFELSSLYTNI